MPHRILRAGLVLAGALGALALPAVAAATGCPAQPTTQTFLPWADQAWYALTPDGGFENGGSGWTLSGGAAVQEGNQTTQAAVEGDHRSLALPDGAEAVSPSFCVDIAHPTVRFFASNAGDPAGVLSVSVRVPLLAGWASLPVGTVTAGGTWDPSPALPIVANLLGLLGHQDVALAFDPAGGDWSIDDVSVDPYSKG